MSRSGVLIFELSVGIIFLLASLAGCGSNHAVTVANFTVPAGITITPAPNLSMELGTNQAFSAIPLTSTGTTINEPVSYLSSNTGVVTVAANGLACAGSWDSLSTPQICTPGPAGIALITATAQGVSSPITTVYVHQHIDKILVREIPPPPPFPPPPGPCFSVGQTVYYAAAAYNHGVDITSTVGVFTWQSLFSNVTNLRTMALGLLPGQLQATAAVPGLTSLFASIGNTNSAPMYFLTCPVQSISLTATSKTATGETITPTIIDSLGQPIPNGTFLTWSSSQPASVSVSPTGVATAVATGGGATIIASCSPPTCNTGLYPSLPIYPENVQTVFTPGAGTTGTVFASSTGCGTTEGCVSNIVPITVPANTLGTFQNLPATPNSLVLDRQGAKAYLGTNSGLLGSVGLAILNTGGGGSQFKGAPGKVLAVSPDGTKVIISDTSPSDGPNQVFVFDAAGSTSMNFQITGATAADFSPDSLKAYIIAGNQLYIYSKIDVLQTIPLTAPAYDVSFLSQGAFPYLAGGTPSAVTVWSTCHSSAAFNTPIATIPVSTVPNFIKTLPGQAQLVSGDTTSTFHMLALASPSIDIISANATPVGCSPGVSNSVSSFNLGQGNFVAKQLIVSQDGATAYIVTTNPGSILVFNIPGQTSSAITLTGNAVPLSASLTPSGGQLYVGANDGTVHVVDTVVGGDIAQITFPQTLCRDAAGLAFPVTCNPDLVAVKP
jgi:hypothetical protein